MVCSRKVRRRISEARAVCRATLRGWKLVERLYAVIGYALEDALVKI